MFSGPGAFAEADGRLAALQFPLCFSGPVWQRIGPFLIATVRKMPRRAFGDKGQDDRKFLEALHYFSVHNITWRALPAQFGKWNSVWKRFWRLSQAGVFEAFFETLAAMSTTAHLVQMFDSTVVRAHVSAAGAKGGKVVRPSAARVVASLPRFT